MDVRDSTAPPASGRTINTARQVLRATWPSATLFAVLLAAWEAWVRLADVDRSVLAPPSRVATALIDTAGPLAAHTGTTLAETAIGLGIGITVGLIAALSIARVSLVRRAAEPLLVVLQTIPPIVLAPVFVLALGFGWAPRVLVVVLIVFFPVAIAAAGAFQSADLDRIDLIRSLGGSQWDVFRHVTFPGALPAIFDGVKISAAYAVAGAAIAEQLGGARSGLGLYIARSQRSFRPDQVIAGVVVIAALSLVLYGLVAAAARTATPWLHAREAK